MNITPKNVKIRNFLSFGNKLTEYEFESDSVVNIKGLNLDVDSGKENSSSNGTGKSSLMQAVVYALFGKGVNDIKQDEFINITNGKDLYVEFNFECNGKLLRIIRTRKPTKTELFIVDEDGEIVEDLTRDSTANTNETIQRLIGVNYDTFVLSFLMTTAVDPLLRRKPSEQRNFMEDLLGMNVLTERAESVKKIRDDVTVEHKVLSRDVENADRLNERERELEEKNKRSYFDYQQKTESEIAEVEETINDYAPFIEKVDEYKDIIKQYIVSKEDLESGEADLREISSDIVKLERKKNSLESDINSRGASLKTKKTQLSEFKNELEVVGTSLDEVNDLLTIMEPLVDDVDKLVNLDEKLVKIDETLDKVDRDIEVREKKKDNLEEEVSHLLESNCPYCHQQWSNDELQKKITELKKALDEIHSEIDALNNEKSTLEVDQKKIEEEISLLKLSEDQCSKILEDYDDASEKAKTLRRDWDTATRRIDQLTKEIEDLESVEDSELQEKLDEVISKIESLEVELKRNEKLVGDLEIAYNEHKVRFEAIPFGSESEVDFMVKDHQRATTRLEELKSSTNPFIHPDEYEGKYVDAAEIQKELATLDDEIKHCNYLVKLLTDSKSFIRRNIIGNYIPYLNKMINTHATQLDSPHTCEIESDLTVSIEYMRQSVSYHSLSAGERLKLDVSVSIALRDLLAMIGVKSGFLMVDELFDSALDTASKRNVFNLIRDRFDTVMLVSHTGEFDGRCDTLLQIVKENGFSRLEKPSEAP